MTLIHTWQKAYDMHHP